MSMIIAPGRFGVAVPPPQRIASARHTANIPVSNPMSWNTEFIDQINAYDAAQPTRLTMQSAGLARFASNRFSGSAAGGLQQLKNGAVFHGMGQQRQRISGSFCGTNVQSAPVEVNAADYFTTYQYEGTADANAYSWQGVEILDPSLKGAQLRKSANQAYSAATLTLATWDTEVYDVAGYHDNVTNPGRITIPVTGLYRLSCNLLITSTTYAWGYMTVNGAVVAGCPQVSHDLDCDLLNMTSAPMQLTAGDYVEVFFRTNVGGSLFASEQTWFAIEKVDPTIKRCLVYPTVAQNATTGAPTINFGAEAYDTDGMFDAATNAQRLYVPAGCTEARLTMNLSTAWNGGKIEPNAFFAGKQSGQLLSSSHSHFVNALGLWVPVSPGDYAVATFYAVNTRAMTLGVSSWLCLEAR